MFSLTKSAYSAAINTSLSAAVVAGVMTLTASYAEAAKYRSIQYGTWKGGIYVRNSTGEFSHCVVSAKYKNGLTLLFSVTKGLQWKVGFSKPTWKLDEGKSYQVLYQVDRKKTKKGKARATTAKLAVIDLPPSSNLFKQMRRGNILRIKAGEDILAFKLTGTNVMLGRLLRCAQRNRDLQVAPAVSSNSGTNSNTENPFTKTKKTAPARSTASNGIAPVFRREADNWFNTYLAASVEPYKIIPNEGSAQKMYRKHALIWRVGQKTGILGTLRIYPKKNTATLENNVLAYEARSCKGDFASKFFKDDGIGSVRASRLMATCQTNSGKVWSTHYTITKRDDGGTYLVTLLSSKAQSADVADAGERLAGTLQTGTGKAAVSPVDDDFPIREDDEVKVKDF